MWAGWTWKEKPAWVRSSRRRGEAEARTSIGRLLQGERSWRAGWCHGNPGPQKRGTWGTRHPAEKKKRATAGPSTPLGAKNAPNFVQDDSIKERAMGSGG